jgi:molybdenum cofactor biosynthesis enzyme
MLHVAVIFSPFSSINTSNAELNPICHLLALLGVDHTLHVSEIRVNVQHSMPQNGQNMTKTCIFYF